MQKREMWIQGMFALLGLVIGAMATYVYTVSVEEQKLSFEERKVGYADFFEAGVKYRESEVTYRKYRDRKERAAKAKENGDTSKAEELESEAETLSQESRRLYDKASFRIGVFSDAAVVRAIAEYWRKHAGYPNCENRPKMLEDVASYQAMRHEMQAEGQVEDKDLILVLFHCILKE
jgi:hypothetical protein